MTGDVRDRILGLLTAGPATVARLSAGLGVAGGVVSYELKLLERDGLVRVGTTRREHGVATPVYVSTAAAAPPILPVPSPLPGLTWIGDEPYPTPLWTVARNAEPGAAERPDADPATPPADATGRPQAGPTRPGEAADSGGAIDPGSTAGFATTARLPTGPGRAAPTATPTDEPVEPGGGTSRAAGSHGKGVNPAAGAHGGNANSAMGAHGAFVDPARRGRGQTAVPAAALSVPRRADLGPSGGPRLHEARRVPMDDATFYEFATRLDALAREFAARATPGAPTTELTILLTRAAGESTSGYGS